MEKTFWNHGFGLFLIRAGIVLVYWTGLNWVGIIGYILYSLIKYHCVDWERVMEMWITMPLVFGAAMTSNSYIDFYEKIEDWCDVLMEKLGRFGVL